MKINEMIFADCEWRVIDAGAGPRASFANRTRCGPGQGKRFDTFTSESNGISGGNEPFKSETCAFGMTESSIEHEIMLIFIHK